MSNFPSRCLVGAAVVAACIAFPQHSFSQDRPDACYAPSSFLSVGAPLVHTGDRLQHGLPIKIVAIGSSSTAGAGASGEAHTYPAQLAKELHRRFPRSDVTVVNKGVGGEETPDMLARFNHDVLDEHPDLLIWQIGSNEILHREADPANFRQQVLSGLARLKAAHIEVILMDAQYAPAILKNPEYPAFNGVLRKVARLTNVALLDRFEVMRYWLASGRQKWPQMVSRDNVHMTDESYHCVGRLLASLIASDLPALASR